MTLATFIQASAHRLDGIADGSVQAIVCSPPYYGLRAYQGDQNVEWPAVEYAPMPGLPPLTIAGCDPGCVHEWQATKTVSDLRTQGAQSATFHGGNGHKKTFESQHATCSKCGGWRGGLGNEPTLEAYIGHLILCLREWRRVLRPDGVCFVNLGDSYSGSGVGGGGNRKGNEHGQHDVMLVIGRLAVQGGLKPKDLMMVPARFALAAQADGWWLRSDIIAAKIAPMPESVQDRFTRSHEHIFMLTKRAKYYFYNSVWTIPCRSTTFL
jgi:DNA modification methylase